MNNSNRNSPGCINQQLHNAIKDNSPYSFIKTLPMKWTTIKIMIALVVISNHTFCQNLYIEYAVTNNGSQWPGQLITNDSITNWAEDPPSSSDISTELPFLIKKYTENVIYLRDFILVQSYYVKDSLPRMKWLLTEDTKTILQQKCHSATTFFRGRNYTAYYSSDIPSTDGPWKFGGLPGLILAISSDDNMYTWTATRIIKNAKLDFTKIPDIRKYKFIGWNEYASKFIQTIDNMVKQSRSDGSMQPGTSIKLKIDAVEIIYPKAQTGEGIGTEQ